MPGTQSSNWIAARILCMADENKTFSSEKAAHVSRWKRDEKSELLEIFNSSTRPFVEFNGASISEPSAIQ